MEKHGPLMKVLWYLPIIPRMKHLFANPNNAKMACGWEEMWWHVPPFIWSIQWKKFDDEFPEFDKESRNIRLGLAIDGMNSFYNMSMNHSSWFVLLVIWNLPPRLCMKRKYMMLFMMISCSRQSGNNIIFLSKSPNWRFKVNVGSGCWSIWRICWWNFQDACHVILHHKYDFLLYGNLPRYSVKWCELIIGLHILWWHFFYEFLF